MVNQQILNQIRGKIIVSCQGNQQDGNPFYRPEDMLQMAEAAERGGCVGFRANTPPNIKAIKERFPDMLMIGIWKVVTEGCDVYITPTMKEVETLIDLKCEIIAVDGTDRVNCNGKKAWELIQEVKEKYPNQLIMADIATLHDAHCAYKAGADIISTTMSGYTDESLDRYALGADFELIQNIRKEIPDAYINAEGRLWTREEALKALECGADVLVIGTAITSPMGITKRFVDYVKERGDKK